MSGLRVLLIDNSISFQETLTTELLKRLPPGSLIERSLEPIDALEKLVPFQPAVIIMNFAMTIITVDGTKFLATLAKGGHGRAGLPVIVYGLMDVNRKPAMLMGASAYIQKPGLGKATQQFYDQLASSIQQTVAAHTTYADNVGPGAIVTKEIWSATLPEHSCPAADSAAASPQPEPTVTSPYDMHGDAAHPIELIAIGSSTGGTEALSTLLTHLRPPLPGIVIVQHIPPMFSRLLSERLDHECALTVKEANTGDIILPNHVYIAPGSKHMTLQRRGGQLVLHCMPGTPVHSVCPSVDVLFQSVAVEVGQGACGIILTGMGRDGADGLLHMRQTGARTIGQDEASCTVYGMPKVAFELGAVETQLPLDAIPAAITSIAKKKP